MPEYTTGKTILGRLPHGSDLLREITRIVNENNITMGTITAIGGLKRARYGILDQVAKQYTYYDLEGPIEIVSCVGSVSSLKQRSMPHIHVALTDKEGRGYGGHVVEGCEVYLCEVAITELIGPKLARDFDPETGMPAWGADGVL
jgi:predicted DNA-binding protein with PD1-like motif